VKFLLHKCAGSANRSGYCPAHMKQQARETGLHCERCGGESGSEQPGQIVLCMDCSAKVNLEWKIRRNEIMALSQAER